MKKLLRDPFILIIAGILLWIAFHFVNMFWNQETTSLMNGAQKSYEQAENETNAVKRKAAFNHSLESFLALEKKYSPTMGNGKLYYDIGNNFFQLEEYPWAILYFDKAAVLRPRDDRVEQNLLAAQSKLQIAPKKEDSPIKKVFFFHNYLSIPERLQLFVALGIVALLFASLYLWLDNRWSNWLMEIFLGLGTILLLSLAYSYYFSPVEAVLVKSSALYRDAGEQYAKVKEEPVASGNKVTVLDQTDSGKWMKVQTSDGSVGYIPYEAVRII